MSDVTDGAISFEAVKTSINQNKDGVILRLAIHPQECPPELLAAWVGRASTSPWLRLRR